MNKKNNSPIKTAIYRLIADEQAKTLTFEDITAQYNSARDNDSLLSVYSAMGRINDYKKFQNPTSEEALLATTMENDLEELLNMMVTVRTNPPGMLRVDE